MSSSQLASSHATLASRLLAEKNFVNPREITTRQTKNIRFKISYNLPNEIFYAHASVVLSISQTEHLPIRRSGKKIRIF